MGRASGRADCAAARGSARSSGADCAASDSRQAGSGAYRLVLAYVIGMCDTCVDDRDRTVLVALARPETDIRDCKIARCERDRAESGDWIQHCAYGRRLD